jgi:hypothetical protein
MVEPGQRGVVRTRKPGKKIYLLNRAYYWQLIIEARCKPNDIEGLTIQALT